MTKRYGFIFDSDFSQYEGQFIGTADEIVKQYLKATGTKLKVGKDEEDALACFVKEAGDNEWMFQDYLNDTGSADGNLEAARASFFEFYLIPCADYEYMIVELATPEQERVFSMSADDILEKMTAKEFLDAGLDSDDLFSLRKWYLQNKLGAVVQEAA